MKWNLGRCLMVLCLSLAGLAQAQAASSEEPAERLERQRGCLQSTELSSLPPLEGKEPKLLRARLTFKASDAEPEVDVLWSDLGAAAKDQILAHLRSYRLPCLGAEDGPQAFVQEFWHWPQQVLPEVGMLWPTRLDGAMPQPCDVGMAFVSKVPMGGLVKFLIKIRFKTDGSEPDVEMVYQSGLDRRSVNVLRDYFRGLRSCLDGRVPNAWFEVAFTLSDRDSQAKPTGLLEMLGAVQGKSALRAHFDTNTMSCPFKFLWEFGQPTRRNSAGTASGYDANRTAFLGWLGTLKLDLSAREEAARFMDHMLVEVPCVVLNLAPEPPQPSGGASG